MGIKHLNTFLRQTCPEVFQEMPLTTLSQQAIAVDASIFVFKIKFSAGPRYAEAALKFIVKIRAAGILPLFVFDGESPPEKATERRTRAELRSRREAKLQTMTRDVKEFYKTGVISSTLSTIHERLPQKRLLSPAFNISTVEEYMKNLIAHQVTIEDFRTMTKVLRLTGTPYVRARGEAEALCSQLARNGTVSAVLTTDTDVLAHRCPLMLMGINGKNFSCVNLQAILHHLNLTETAWVDFCILCGTDYNPKVPRISITTAYHLLKRYRGRVENIPHFDLGRIDLSKSRSMFMSEVPDPEVVTKSDQEDLTRSRQRSISEGDTAFPDEKGLEEFLRIHGAENMKAHLICQEICAFLPTDQTALKRFFPP